MNNLTQIQEFLGQKRLAVVGVSRNPKDFTRSVYAELLRRDYDVVPVNPEAPDIAGRRCYAHVTEIEPPVDGALLMTKPAVTDRVVQECQAAGIRKIWMYRATGSGAVSTAAVRYCAANGMSVVAGECPFMFLPESAWFHRFHGFCRRLVGSYSD
ncbi:MAG: CoA-binding protein [Ignavibacteriota bacterium]